MLVRKSYSQEYVDSCRNQIDSQVAAYKRLIKVAKSLDGAESSKLDAAASKFEPMFFNDLALLLDNYFVHRMRGMEGKDGNPLNEVRVICSSILENGGKFTPDSGIKLKPESSLLGYDAGDEIKLNATDFGKLAKGFFAELQLKFVS